MMSLVHAAPLATDRSTGGRLVAPDGRVLPFRGGTLAVDAASGVARVILRQRFTNPYPEPLHVTYQVPLPADAAVSGYAFELGEERVTGEVETRGRARERFEEALVDGRTAALLEEDRSSLFTQEVGNVPPGADVVCELLLDQRLAWVKDGWEWRFPTVVAPRYLGAEGRVRDAGRVTVDVAADGTEARIALSLRIRDDRTGPVVSPTHRLAGDGLAEDAPLDRDIAVRWPVSAPSPGLAVDVARAPAERSTSAFACALLAIVPPTGRPVPVPRDLVVLLDTSGSMSGRPLSQAQAVTNALVDTLGDADSLELIEFSSRPRAWKSGATAATAANRASARRWVSELRAGGGTEMRDGITAALASLRGEAQRQVIVVTDGLIGFEKEIVREVAERLPRGSRVHTLGIGSGVNRSLLGPVARAGGGIEVIVGLDEDAGEAAARLVAATAAPLVVDLEVGGTALLSSAQHRAPDLLAGRPALLAVRLRPEGGTLTVRGHTAGGPWEAEQVITPVEASQGSGAVVALVGRELVEEAELNAARGQSMDAEIERLGLDFQIATRLTSWVAVSRGRTVDPTRPTRRERVPQALPYGTSVAGLGLRGAALPAPAGMPARSYASRPLTLDDAVRAPLPQASGGAPAPADEKRRAGPIARAKAALSDLLGGRPQPLRAPAAPPRRLRGRIAVSSDGKLVVEVEITDADLPWFPAGDAQIRLADGRVVAAVLDPASSTGPGHLGVGQVVRIALLFSGTLGPVAGVELVAEPRSGLTLAVDLG